jgi:hypothetical protein
MPVQLAALSSHQSAKLLLLCVRPSAAAVCFDISVVWLQAVLPAAPQLLLFVLLGCREPTAEFELASRRPLRTLCCRAAPSELLLLALLLRV